ncbi:glycoside hydrolase family 20 zincin-like fold domain-containing protein, partial [Balneolaceae bacterium ANBcel3]|nr:glycoside hydrolase family 20 zincin-like fold domain-containing protein [Balneolaceae bacterium ANBcel3]
MRLLLIVVACLLPFTAFSQKTYLLYDDSSPQAGYAAKQLQKALTERGYSVTKDRSEYEILINLDINRTALSNEAYAIIPENHHITVNGGDGTGLIYGALTLAEKLRDGVALNEVTYTTESPKFPFRAIKHNLPWDTYRPSYALDQHFETARKVEYWEVFLDMMVQNRLNVITLWMMHPFTYMIMPENFPEASPFTEEELAEWQHLFQSIFAMAKDRGIDTYIINWSIFVSEEFAKAHNVAHQNFYPYYYVQGDTTEIVKRYTRESVTQILNEYPDLDGFGISHGEGMAGMTPRHRQDWMNETMIAGMQNADRPVKLIHRVPFSADTLSDGSTDPYTELLTREAMEELEDQFDGPIWVEMKFNWSHAHSTPTLVKVHGGELGDTYFVPEPKNYKVTWMARNEDFFALRWGVPDFIRAHIETNDASYVGGYFIGSDTYIPAKDYFTKISDPVDWTYA